MINFESAFVQISELVKDFQENVSDFLSPSYQEAEVRRDFIDKFFEALGWDVYHKQQKNPYEQEVKVEKGVSIGRAQKRADYAFFISPEFRTPKFFAEAKKPSRNLKNADDYFQTIRYGWNANTPVAVLTDFQELHILDCRIKPNINTVLENPAHKSYYLDDYIDLEKFSEIFYLLSRDAVAGGSLEKYSGSLAKPKGKIKAGLKSVQAIDEDFLEYIDGIRERLAKAFKKNDETLSSEELTEATQRTIDRLVFIRFLEDKLIEPQNIISEFGRRGNAFRDFISSSRSLDSKYNGIVFKEHFIDKQDFKGPNEAEFKKICEEFSHLNSPYDFNAIPVHIIGSIYERFLGKVVNATAHRVKVEEKPEVRKAGGVYYTPKYIVDYIVENTVGKIIKNDCHSRPDSHSLHDSHSLSDCHSREGGNPLENTGKTPAEISKLRFADIACGSGSFLIGVFETLLKYHTEYYNQNPEQARKDGCIEKDGAFILSIKQKQKILQNNIYGVDIDLQAVEVTQLSLALKMLEDETTATANEMQVLFHEKILPDLSKNIVCGNSLIGTDILEGKMFGTDEERKLNPMDFETTFPDVFKSGGFDAIVGNPPYVRNREIDNTIKIIYSKLFITASGQYDLYQLFYEKGISITKNNGLIGFITSNKFTIANYGLKLREYILNVCQIKEIIDVSNIRVFKDASTYPYIVLIKKGYQKNNIIKYYKAENDKSLLSIRFELIYQNVYENSNTKNFVLKKEPIFFNKLENNVFLLSDIASIKETIHTGNIRNKLILSKFKDNNSKKLLYGKNCHRYYIEWDGKYIDYNKQLINKNKNEYANLCEPKYFDNPKILLREIANTIECYLDLEKYYTLNKLYSIQLTETDISIYYLCGILNSKLLSYYFRHKFEEAHIRGGYLQFKKIYTSQLPIPKIYFENEALKKAHDKIVSLVEQMLEAKKQLHGSKTEKDKIYFERKCDSLDKQIDAEVYKLYGLTEDEIKIVEGI